ncbi:MAG: hypothetical protein IJE51_03195 [Clostridia bacterium]|nr:hypothetical protein [Clostridia bacterium]
MNNFSRKNLNNIKNICSEKTGVELPEAKPVNGVKIASVILAIILVLTPFTAYAAQYTMSVIEYLDSEKNVKAEALGFAEDFMAFAYGDSDTYIEDGDSEDIFYDYLRQSAYLFKNDNYLKTTYNLGYSLWETVETYIFSVKNDGNIWYVTVNADVEESNYKGVLNEYLVKFYLKYEGSGEYFVLTDMYFYDSLGHSDEVFGNTGIIDTINFEAWAENNNDYSKYVEKISPETVDVISSDSAEKFAMDFVMDYISYVYGQETPFADKEGDIYTIIDSIKEYKVLTGLDVCTFKYVDIFKKPVSIRTVKKGDSWYAQCRVHGEVFNSDGVHVTDYGSYIFLKYKYIDGEYMVEDLNMSGPNSDYFNIFGVDSTETITSFEGFILWADATNDYSEYVLRCEQKKEAYIIQQKVLNAAYESSKAFMDASFNGGKNIWDNGATDDLTVLMREYVEYLKLAYKDLNITSSDVKIREPYSTTVDGNEHYVGVVAGVTLPMADGTEMEYLTKFFYKYEASVFGLKLVDFYYYGLLPETHEVFEKVGKNNYSLTWETFIEWAAEEHDYSFYTAKIRDAVAKIK